MPRREDTRVLVIDSSRYRFVSQVSGMACFRSRKRSGLRWWSLSVLRARAWERTRAREENRDGVVVGGRALRFSLVNRQQVVFRTTTRGMCTRHGSPVQRSSSANDRGSRRDATFAVLRRTADRWCDDSTPSRREGGRKQRRRAISRSRS